MKSTVLIIEDNEQNMYMLSYLLQKNNYNVWALSSTHKDSEVLAKVLKRWGVNLIRGSSTTGWKNAIVEMKNKLFDILACT